MVEMARKGGVEISGEQPRLATHRHRYPPIKSDS